MDEYTTRPVPVTVSLRKRRKMSASHGAPEAAASSVSAWLKRRDTRRTAAASARISAAYAVIATSSRPLPPLTTRSALPAHPGGALCRLSATAVRRP